MTSYDRPIQASLHVHLENGEQWEAGPEDFAKFLLVNRFDAYRAFSRKLADLLREAGLIQRDVTEAQLNPLRYLVATALLAPDQLDQPDYASDWREVVDIERFLQGHADRGTS